MSAIPAIREAAAEFSSQRIPGVIYGPEHGGWCGFYLPFPIGQVVGGDAAAELADRTALAILATAIEAFRPDRSFLSAHENEVIEIMQAAVKTLKPEKVIV